MALLWFDGLQDVLTVMRPEWSGGPWSANQTGRDGTTNSAASFTIGSKSIKMTLPTPAATCIFGTAHRNGNTGGTLTVVSMMTFLDSAGTVQLWVGVNASGMIEARRTSSSGTLLGTSSGHSSIGAGEWHYYEAKVVLATGTGGSVAVHLDGMQVLSLTGIATSSTNSSVYSIQLGSGSGSGLTIVWDDMYVCDATDGTATQGRANNDFLGDVKVDTMTPNGAGDSTAWTPTTGANWSCVDEIPPNTTDYVSAASTGLRDLYNMSEPVGTVGTVFGVQTAFYATKTDAGSASIKAAVKENGVVTTGSAQALTFGSWTGIFGQMRPVRPSDGANWTASDLSALQVGQESA